MANNYYKNLEWITPKNNTIHGRGVKIVQKDISTGEIIAKYDSITCAKRALNLKTDISIHMCLNGKYQHGYGYKWELQESDK